MNKKLIIWSVIAALGSLALCSTVCGADKTVDKSIEVKRLSLASAHEPVPVMKYRLLPRRLDQKAGNAALLYYSAAALCPDENPNEMRKKIDDWRALPADQLPRQELDEVLSSFENCFHYIELAAQRAHCQWDMPLEDGYALQLPALSVYRSMAMAMQLKIRLLIADGQMEQALEMLQHGLHMGHGIAQGPTVIQGLVGTAITALMLKEVEGLMQMSDAPSLYWALTALPDPLVDMYPSLENEREILFVEFPQLRNLETELLSTGQASAAVSSFLGKIQSLGGGMDELPFKGLVPAGWVMIHYFAAKEHLAHRGFSQERIETMPAAQAVLIYQKQEYLDMLDGMFKWFTVPYYQAQPHLQRSEQRFDDHRKAKGIKANLFSVLLPALSRIAFLEARLDRHVALLRTIEAIRLFAADHSGQLPDALADITQVPIPTDPVTGQTFLYKRKDAQSARLEAPVSPAESKKRPVYDLAVRP
jgi:hypothetical protein